MLPILASYHIIVILIDTCYFNCWEHLIFFQPFRNFYLKILFIFNCVFLDIGILISIFLGGEYKYDPSINYQPIGVHLCILIPEEKCIGSDNEK